MATPGSRYPGETTSRGTVRVPEVHRVPSVVERLPPKSRRSVAPADAQPPCRVAGALLFPTGHTFRGQWPLVGSWDHPVTVDVTGTAPDTKLS